MSMTQTNQHASEQAHTFKPGDRVVCIHHYGDMLVEGRAYTVRAIDGEWLGLIEPTADVTHASGCGWHHSRFRRAEIG